MPNQPKTGTHTVRIDDELWREALFVTRHMGTSNSEIARLALHEYVAAHRAEANRRAKAAARQQWQAQQ